MCIILLGFVQVIVLSASSVVAQVESISFVSKNADISEVSTVNRVVHKKTPRVSFEEYQKKDVIVSSESDEVKAKKLHQIIPHYQFENSLNTDTVTVDHKQSIIYQGLQILPESHRTALHYLTIKESKQGSRGLGGGNTVILQTTDLGDEELLAVFIHEMGHVVDTGMIKGSDSSGDSPYMDGNIPVQSDDKSVSFYNISWQTTTLRNDVSSRNDFVSGYAMMDPFEDFAESYVYYILHGTTFRSMLPSSSILEKKYNFLKEEVFDGKEFSTGKSIQDIYERMYDSTLRSYDIKTFLQWKL